MPAPDMIKFLYTILKQLDLRSVDWNEVAKEVGVTNGHASRMRYSRFRQQMEGHVPVRRPRTPGQKRTLKKAPKQEENKAQAKVKTEHRASVDEQNQCISPANTTPEPGMVKPEPQEDDLAGQLPLPPYQFGPEHMPREIHGVTDGTPAYSALDDFSNLEGFEFGGDQFQGQYQPVVYGTMMDGMMDTGYTHVMGPAIQNGFACSDGMQSDDKISGIMDGRIMVKREERWD